MQESMHIWMQALSLDFQPLKGILFKDTFLKIIIIILLILLLVHFAI